MPPSEPSLSSALRLGRSHFLFIAALLSAAALILLVERRDPDGWGRARTEAYGRALAGQDNWQVRVGAIGDGRRARAICAAARRHGAACTVEGPSR